MPASPILLLTVDVEEFVLPAEAGLPFDATQAYDLGREGLEAALEVLDGHAVAATHFVTAAFARRFPALVHRLIGRGDEVALHAEDHAHDYSAMGDAEARALLLSARLELERDFGVPVKGYRANRFRAPSREVLRDAGLQWTSNLHPTWVPGAYDHRRAPRVIHRDGDLVEIPISVTPRLRLPISWFWMRNFGGRYLRSCAPRAIRGTGYLNLYVHGWEYAALPRVRGLSVLQRLSMRRTGAPFVRLLDRFLTWAAERGFVPSTITPYLRDGGWLA